MNTKFVKQISKVAAVIALIISAYSVIAQTPYDSYAPSKNKREMLKLPDATFKAYNVDTTSEVSYVELDNEIGVLTYFDKRDSVLQKMILKPLDSKWISIDPHASKYPYASPYNYVNNNPIEYIDPDGQDWFKYKADGDKKEGYHWQDGHTYNLKTGVGKDGKDVFKTLTGYKAVVLFEGSRNEKLGAEDNLFGKGAVLAKVTVYGPGGADDIKEYQGFTMTSNFKTFGAIDDGDYTVYYRDPGKKGPLNSHWAINNTHAVNSLDGRNPSPIEPYSSTQKDGAYIHTSNKNGWAGVKYDKEGKLHAVTTGCLLIVPSQYDINGNVKTIGWDQFNQQLNGLSQYHLELTGRK